MKTMWILNAFGSGDVVFMLGFAAACSLVTIYLAWKAKQED